MIQFYNSLNNQKEEFIPLDPQHVQMYVCGPTVYDYIHFGNARPLVVFDVLYRLLCHDYPRVTYVRNVTDIDDKIIVRAQESGRTATQVVEETLGYFHHDIDILGILKTSLEPKATEYIPEMIAMIESLIASHHAYVAEQHVLFSSQSYNDYGKLSGRSIDEQIAGVRVEVASYKQDARDFVLWKPSNEDQPGWESPWGRGRPGWHIECSAMSAKLLGANFDIHGGGQDLMFPHHENERAQSCCAHPGSQFARYWLHNGMITVNGEKMSKSLGNFVTLNDMLNRFPADAVRLQLLSAQYRKELDSDDRRMQQTLSNMRTWAMCLDRAGLSIQDAQISVVDAPFLAALRDDLNTPLAISRMNALAKTDPQGLLGCLAFLGLDPQAAVKESMEDIAEADRQKIDALVDLREQARKARDFLRADEIRDQLAQKGIEVIDEAGGSRWQMKR